MIEWTISLGAIITGAFNVLALAGAISAFYYSTKFFNQITATQLTMLAGRMINVENELKELTHIVIIQARQDEKITAATQNLIQFRTEYSERHRALEDRVARLEAIRDASSSR